MELAIQLTTYKLVINETPLGAVRMTQRDKWKPSAQKYLRHKSILGYHMRQTASEPFLRPVEVKMVFTLPVSPSTPKKHRKTLLGTYHTNKPDLDNIVKSIFDSANGILWGDDKLVVKCSAEKRYGEQGKIEIEIIPV